jgi:ATP-dependent helicase/nuclease subunit A
MRKPHTIPPDVRKLQREVSNPGVSAWVAANAGSGKTHVLVQRVINLLLDGVEPEKILCITFTKAAAANMAKRVFDMLAGWTTLDDAELDTAIAEAGMKADPRRRASARRLFARALETPGGLKVQTIHAFCTQLLHQFPFEANVVARFTVLDEAEHGQLLEQLTLNVLLAGAAEPDSPLGRALAAAMIAAADQTFRDVVREAIGQHDIIARWVHEDGVDTAITTLSQTLGVEPTDSIETIEAQFFSASLIAASEWLALAKTLTQGSKTDSAQADRFGGLAALADPERLVAYLSIFCTSQGAPRKSIVTKAIKDKDPALVERLCAEQARICVLLDKRRAVVCRDRSAALLTVAYEVLKRYHSEKQRRGFLDYDDLIDKTLELLSNVDAAWVHYKLDLGIDHLLIDEAQDTSNKQWQIVQKLVTEFAAGTGARDVRRTIFAVGDVKQSIFSFQDAAPEEYVSIGRDFWRTHEAAGLKFIIRELKHSFRSGANILAAVDEVFKSPEMTKSVASIEQEIPPHIALDDTPPGLVEIWEPEQPDPPRDIEGWDAPFDTVSETSPRVKLAQRIARTVRRLIDTREPVGIERRAVKYGDLLVLVRQRGPLFEAIIRALKNENVEVAGADRLVLTEHIAVMDLMALADALLLPQDDLALATVLRSPLFGFSDDDLFAIAWDRGPLSLRASLAKMAAEKEIFATADGLLDAFAAAARRETSFAFFADVLGAGGGRKRFLARLGPEANDALDEFLNLAFDYERRRTPSLQGFVAWLRQARAEVRRDMEIARDEVRVMTVHGAKGLEAPIVILADTMTPPTGPRPPRLLELADGPLVWAGRSADDVACVSGARNKTRSEAEDEYRRLLYVAMTRAADRLIVCGADGARKRPDGCWYDLIRESLKPFLVEEDDSGEKAFLYCKTVVASERVASPVSNKRSRHPALPLWLREPARAQPSRSVTLSPSSAFDDVPGGAFAPNAASAADRQKALERGRIVHRLMQSLPDIAAERRKTAAERYLASAAANFSAEEQAAIVQKILAILDDKNFAEIFTAGSRAELPIVGRFARDGAPPIYVSGQVDRLAVSGDAVLIADYKTDRAVPRSLGEVKPYVTQLALYRAVLARLYPGKSVRAALLFTEGPLLMEVPAAAMDEAFTALMAKPHAPLMMP